MWGGCDGWLVLAFPLAGSILIALLWRSLPGRTAGWIGSAAILLSFLSAIGALVQLQDRPEHERLLTSSLWDYASTAGLDVKLGIRVTHIGSSPRFGLSPRQAGPAGLAPSPRFTATDRDCCFCGPKRPLNRVCIG